MKKSRIPAAHRRSVKAVSPKKTCCFFSVTKKEKDKVKALFLNITNSKEGFLSAVPTTN